MGSRARGSGSEAELSELEAEEAALGTDDDEDAADLTGQYDDADDEVASALRVIGTYGFPSFLGDGPPPCVSLKVRIYRGFWEVGLYPACWKQLRSAGSAWEAGAAWELSRIPTLHRNAGLPRCKVNLNVLVIHNRSAGGLTCLVVCTHEVPAWHELHDRVGSNIPELCRAGICGTCPAMGGVGRGPGGSGTRGGRRV